MTVMTVSSSLITRLQSRLAISVLKSTICYTIGFILIFLEGFDDTIPYPIVGSSLLLITIAGTPGKNVGAVLDSAFFGAVGIAIGGFMFYLLALMHASPVAQGFVFFFVVYGFAYVKSISLRYFGFSLLGIIVAFSGIYTSVLLGEFVPAYLQSYLTTYAYGFAIVLLVNLAVIPLSAERELREFIVVSLEHVSTFAHLLSKTYTLEITEEEVVLRDSLNATIRADFGYLQMKLAETSVELNWTRYSMADYAQMTARIRTMQQGLITCYSTVVSLHTADPVCRNLIEKQLVGIRSTFARVRRSADLISSDITSELSFGRNKKSSHSAAATTSWDDFIEKTPSNVNNARDLEDGNHSRSLSVDDSNVAFSRLRQQLSKEVENAHDTEEDEEVARKSSTSGKEKIEMLRTSWATFERDQRQAIARMMEVGLSDRDLLIHKAGPSIQELYPHSHSRRPSPPSSTSSQSKTDAPASSSQPDTTKGSEIATVVLRFSSFLAGLSTVVDQLAGLHSLVIPDGGRPKKSLHLHFFESIPRSTQKPPLSIPQATAVLEGRTYTKPRIPIWRRIAMVETALRSESSVYAFQTAVAVIIFSVFLLAPSLLSFFVQYSLTGGIITLVVSMTPTLGQSLFTFVLQICGTGIGSVYGLIVLEICRNRSGDGGLAFNPYGMVILICVYSIPLSYLIYAKPTFFALSLLAMNGTGVIVVTEWVYTSVPGQIRPDFDSPALRTGKALVAMSIALVIAATFQSVLRTPARRKLRLKLAKITHDLASYNILFQLLMTSAAPIDDTALRSPPPPEALETLRLELISREGAIQLDILSLFPLLKFSSVEPDFGRPFNAPTMSSLISKHQLILDRLREARTAIGVGFNKDIHRNFTAELAPYRSQARRYSRALFYLCSTSIATKIALPNELPSMSSTAQGITHDAVVISSRLMKSEEGKAIVSGEVFLRYWWFLNSYTAVGTVLEAMETDLRVLFDGDSLE